MNDHKTPDKKPVRAGRFYTKEKISEFRANFTKGKAADVRQAEFFSRNIIEQLLNIEDCDGLAIYYGTAHEDENNNIVAKGGKPQPRLFLVPVKVERDANGEPTNRNEAQTFKLQIEGWKEVEEDFGGAGNGKPMPPF
ncbi:MAG: hypothetical protein ACK4GN_14920 [Runella sp.]